MESNTPYRDDEGAREFHIDHLEAENASLEAENASLKAENTRLKIISTELLRESPPVARSQFVDVHLRRQIEESERTVARARQEIAEVRRSAFWAIVILVGVPLFFRVLSFLL
jgi:predicted RNase H-like nuclease (RuvC/YqgF family)